MIFLRTNSNNMKCNFLTLLIALVLFSSCKTSDENKKNERNPPMQGSVVLANRTCALIDLFLDNTKQWRKGNEQIIIGGYPNANPKYFMFWIYANDPMFKPFGMCNGIVNYKDNEVILFGDSWDGYFWSNDTIYELVDDSKGWAWEYDPPSWDICIRVKDTSILRGVYSNAPMTSLPPDNLPLLDSIEKILRQ